MTSSGEGVSLLLSEGGASGQEVAVQSSAPSPAEITGHGRTRMGDQVDARCMVDTDCSPHCCEPSVYMTKSI